MESIFNYTNTNVKFLREQKGISQGTLSDNLNIDQSTLAKWENNTRQITLEWSIKIAEYFDVPIGDFIAKDLRLLKSIPKNKYDDKIKELETKSGIKISYSTEKPLTQEDYLDINQLVLEAMKEQKKENKEKE